MACPLFQNNLRWHASLLSKILHVRVDAEPRVIRQIPSVIVWIGIENDVIGVPHPVADIAHVIRCNAEVEAIEPETVWTAAAESPTMTRSEPSGEAPVLKRLVHAVVRIIASRVVTDPGSAVIDVRGVWMARLVAEVALLVSLLRIDLALMLIALTLAGGGLTLVGVTLVLVGLPRYGAGPRFGGACWCSFRGAWR